MSSLSQTEKDRNRIIPILKGMVKRGWIPLRQMAILMGCAPATLYSSDSFQQVPAIKVGARWRINEADVIKLLQTPIHPRYKPQCDAIHELYLTIKRRHARSIERGEDPDEVKVYPLTGRGIL